MNGTRLNEDWLPDPSLRAWAVGRRPELNVDEAIEQFVDYWTALPGQKATKLDWNKTFRNWIRNMRVMYSATHQVVHHMGKTAYAMPKPPSHAPAKPALDRLPDDKRRENLERLSGMFDNLFQKVT